jgi:hypothetical protein
MIIPSVDFSEKTLNIYNNVKSGESSLSELISVLYNNDYPKNDILNFIKKEFKSLYSIYKKLDFSVL